MALDWQKVTEENVSLLTRLLQFDTTNPPGNEDECVRWIQAELKRDGIDSVYLEPAPRRGNLVARLRARGAPEGGPLLLLGHVDVVPAVAEEWTHPPFSGKIDQGCVWGRGALDMKGTVATWVTLFRLVHRLGGPLRRDLILMVNADEEAGGQQGAGWVAEHHWDLIECEAALNEGGGQPIQVNGVTYYTYAVDEKRACRFRIVARGRPGHASTPHDDNAVVHLARAVAALGSGRTPVHVDPTFALLIRTMAEHQPEPMRSRLLEALDPARADAALDAAIADERLRDRLRAMLRNTIAPTMLQAGSKVNVIPSSAECWVDCRALPGHGPETVRPEVEAILREAGVLDRVELEFVSRPGFPSSPTAHPLVEAMGRAMARHAPGSPLVPVFSTGGTDSRFLRPRGVPAYGFYPTLPEVPRGTVHGTDERVPIRQVEWASRIIWDILVDYVGVPSA